MANPLDMSLDEIIEKNKQSRGQKSNITVANDREHSRRRGGGGGGPNRRFVKRGSTRTHPYSSLHYSIEEGSTWKYRAMQGHEMQAMTRRKVAGTKLYVSNLHREVSDEDIKVLFSDVGELKRYGIHYDVRGRSKGTAEVVFATQAEALAAMEKYDNLHLDGKPLKIDLIGIEFVVPSQSPSEGSWIRSEPWEVYQGRGQGFDQEQGGWRSCSGPWDVYRGGGQGFDPEQGRHRSGQREIHRGRGQGFEQDQGRHKEKKSVTAEDLDADLETYHLKAMQIK